MDFGLGSYDHFALALAALLGTFIATGGMLWLAERSRFHNALLTFQGIVPPFLNVVGVLFALNLAFLANDTWAAHDRARDAVFTEAGALRGILLEVRQLPEALRGRIENAAQAYLRLSVNEEWPLLSNRRSDPKAVALLDGLQSDLSSPALAQAVNPPVQAMLLQQISQVRAMHDLRVALSQTHVNPLKWLGMAFLGFLTVVSIVMVHVEHPRAAFLSALIFAAASAPTAAIVLVQGNPFQEPLGVSAQPLAAVADKGY